MIGVSEIAVAALASLVIAILVVLAATLVVRLARVAIRSVRARALRTGVGADDDRPVRWDQRRAVAVAGCLVVAAVAGLLGTVLPLYRDFPHRGDSISLYSTMHYTAITTYLDLALLVGLAYVAFRRRDRLIAAVIVGYCADAVGSFAVFVSLFTAPHTHVGPGYYLLGVGHVAEVAAIVLSIGIVVTGRADRTHSSPQSLLLGFAAAALIAGAATMDASKVGGEPLWIFSLVPTQTAAAIIVGAVALAVVPLLAVRLADRASAFMVLGLATGQVLAAAGAALEKLYRPRFTELTLGFWLTAFAALTLVLLAFALAESAQPSVRASSPIGPGETGPVGVVQA